MSDMFYYDAQVRRFLAQIIAVFSNFNVTFGKDDDGNTIYHRVPVRYATTNKMVASIIKQNSENIMNAVPAMAVYVTGLEYDRERIQNPTFVDKTHVRQRRYNRNTGEYTSQPGNTFTVERLMPVPYMLRFNVDIWTSNQEQKFQALEQILVLFNPDLEIQSTDNYLDWTSLSYIHIDSVNFSSNPIGASDEDIDIATLGFYCPIWLSAPAKLKKLGVIENIVASVYDANGNYNPDLIESMERFGNRQYVTPTGYNLIVLNGQATLYPNGGPLDTGDSIDDLPSSSASAIAWGPYISQLGELKNGITQLRLRKDNPDTVSEIVGTVSYHPTDPNVLLFNVDNDTIPGNTLLPVDAIIDPTRSAPGINGLDAAEAGQRYLLLSGINTGKDDTSFDGADAWKSNGNDFFAEEYDIIEYTGSEWVVSWSADRSSKYEYITNLTTGLQYKWNREDWVKSWEGEYPAGQWSLVF